MFHRTTKRVPLLVLTVVWLGLACGSSPSGNANSANLSLAGNANSAKATRQADTTPVTMAVDTLMGEFDNAPMATYEKYKERMMTVTGKLKSVTLSDGASNTFEIQLQTANDSSGKGRFSCFSKVSFETGNTYRSLGIRLDGLKQTNQLGTAPTVTLNGLYPNLDETLRGSPPSSIGLQPCDMITAPQ